MMSCTEMVVRLVEKLEKLEKERAAMRDPNPQGMPTMVSGVDGIAADIPIYAGAKLFVPESRPEEVRHTSVTGGQKGRKAVRYDLIPQDFLAVVERLEPHSSVESHIRRLTAWWNERHMPAVLGSVACDITTGMGGVGPMLALLASVYGQGALKYNDDNWKKGYPWSWSYAAALRHLYAASGGEHLDPESKLPHLAHAWWHCAVLWHFSTYAVGQDDRPAPALPWEQLRVSFVDTAAMSFINTAAHGAYQVHPAPPTVPQWAAPVSEGSLSKDPDHWKSQADGSRASGRNR